MKKSDIEYFKKLLFEKRDELLRELGALRDTTVSESSRISSGDTSGYSYHMADLGTDSNEREKAYLFLARENKYLGYLNEAIERIERDEYGICKECSKQIPKARLKAVPHASMCVPCKTKTKESGD